MSKGKKPRLSADECKERLVVAGLDALAERGLSIGLDAVNLEQAVRDAEVPRSSAYAAWSGKDDRSPQELFQQAVLMRAVQARRETEDAFGLAISDFLEAIPEGLSKREQLRELIRRTATANLRAVLNSRSCQIVFAMRSIVNTASSQSLLDEELLAWIQTTEQTLRNETIETLYKPMAAFFGMQPRPEYGDKAWHLAEIASSSLSEGLSMRYRLPAGNYFYDLQHPEAAGEDWSLMALLFERIIDVFFEPRNERET